MGEGGGVIELNTDRINDLSRGTNSDSKECIIY
jgi:hypothetical protein